ncbi:MAG: sulfurtransferase [Thiotrichales bacterium]|nr:MAG: sulfurtransferase [Thiotrichales bacterium]
MQTLSLIIEPEELETLLDDASVVIVDLCKAKQYRKGHIPGAHFVNYPDIVHIEKPVMGLLPSAEQFSRLVSGLGITRDTHVVAYDDEGGGCASRFIWTLHVFGHMKTSLLNGGLFSWANEGHPLTTEVPPAATSDYSLTSTGKFTADRQFILQHMEDENVALLDARSLDEYKGTKKFSNRGGHIPGAARYEWTDAMDRMHNLRLLPAQTIQQQLDRLGISKDREVIVYCQSHHRSALSYVMLRSLGYERVKGYPGSWSEWGNRDDTPVEQ